MDIQEQEEADYQAGMNANGLQDCLEESMLNRKPDDKAKIAEAVKAGKFVTYFDGIEYCPITDAIMGSRLQIIKVCDTREEANQYAHQYATMEDEGGEVRILVQPFEPRVFPKNPAIVADSSDCPF